MVSPDRLILLLMSSLLLSAVIVSTSPDQNQVEEVTTEKLKKAKEDLEKVGKVIRENIEHIRNAVVPFIGLIPTYGAGISAAINLILVIVSGTNQNPVLSALKSEFENLNFKIDEYHLEQKWDIWASSVYSKPERKINTAWTIYNTFLSALETAKTKEEKQRQKDEFIAKYIEFKEATTELYNLLTNEGTSFVMKLSKMLSERLTCHEQLVKRYTLLIDQLIAKGNIMNTVYNKLKEIENEATVKERAKIAYKSASAMYQIHKYCIIKSAEYIEKDVKRHIDENSNHQQLAKTVRSVLADSFNRYDWMAVAFTTKNSKHTHVKTLNRHTLSGFIEVTKGEVSVAVARQVKGSHTLAEKVKTAIRTCVDESVLCYKVENQLKECSQSVEGIKVSETYTAMHAFTRKGHDSYKEKDAEEEEEEEEVNADPDDPSDNLSFIYVGKCKETKGGKTGKFVVMIKSDDEMKTKDPCKNLDCGEAQKRGKCVRAENIFVALCDCEDRYYGQHCENDIADYTENTQNENKQNRLLVQDKRRRTK